MSDFDNYGDDRRVEDGEALAEERHEQEYAESLAISYPQDDKARDAAQWLGIAV